MDRFDDYAQERCKQGRNVDGSEMGTWRVCEVGIGAGGIFGKIPPEQLDRPPTIVVAPEDEVEWWEDPFVTTDDELPPEYREDHCRDITYWKCLANHTYGIDEPSGGGSPFTINIPLGSFGLGVDLGSLSASLDPTKGSEEICEELGRQAAAKCALAEGRCQRRADCGGDPVPLQREGEQWAERHLDAGASAFALRWAAFAAEANLDEDEREAVLGILGDWREARAEADEAPPAEIRGAIEQAVKRKRSALPRRRVDTGRDAQRRLRDVLDDDQMEAFERYLGAAEGFVGAE